MPNHDNPPEKAADRRRQAEKYLQEKAARLPPVNASLSPAETQGIQHELEVHQVELEMQNDELRRAQVELDAERERYFTLFELAPVGYCTISEKGLIDQINLTAASLLGITRPALLKKPFSRFIAKEDQPVYYQHRKQLLETAQTQSCELRMLKEDGTLWWARLEAAVDQIEVGSPSCRITLNNITVSKMAEDALRKSEVQLTAILDATPFPIALVDTDDNKIEFWSRSALALFGHTAPTAEEWYQLAYPDPDYRREVVERWKPCLEKARLTGQAVNTGEYRVACRDGSVRICELYAAFLGDRLIVTFNDITGRKKAEEARRESEVRFRELFNRTSSGIAVYKAVDNGEDFIFADFNPAAERIEKISRKDILGKRVSEVFPGVKAFGIFEVFQRVWKTAQPEYFPQTIYRDDRDIGSWRENWVFKLASGEVVAIYNDISDRMKAVEMLRASEQNFRTIWETMLQGVVHQAAEGKIISINPAAERILGQNAAELMGTTSVDQEHATLREDGSPFPGLEHPSMLGLQTGKASHDVVMGVYNPRQKAYRWINISAVPLFRSGETTPYQVYTIFDDITERKKTEDALRESDDRYYTLFKKSVSPVALTKMPEGTFFDVNDAFEELLGYSKEELFGKTSIEAGIVTPEQRNQTLREFAEKGIAKHNEKLLHTRSGKTLVVLSNVNSIKIGKEIYALTTVEDITERKKVEAALRTSEAQHRTILQTAMDGFWIVNLQGRLLDVNQAYSRMSGYSQQELLAMSIADMEVVESGNDTSAHIRKVIENGEDRFETRHRRKDGSLFYVEISVQYRSEEGGTLVAFLRDITERKLAGEKLEHSYQKEKQQRQELQEEAKARGMFIDILAHELRTPLTPVAVCSAMLQDMVISQESGIEKKLVENMFNGTQSLKQRLEELLDLGKISRGTFTLRKQMVDVTGLVSQTAARFKPLAEQQSRQLILEIQDNLPVIVADPARLEQVLATLLSNAVRYSPKNTTITLKAAKTDTHIVIEVMDEGKAISADEQKKLFDSYHRVMQDTQRYSGIGLGLAISKQIVEAHGGSIRMESHSANNTCFRVEIPVKGLEGNNETTTG